MSKITYAQRGGSRTGRGGFVRFARVFILLGVWSLVGLAGLAVWSKLAG